MPDLEQTEASRVPQFLVRMGALTDEQRCLNLLPGLLTPCSGSASHLEHFFCIELVLQC